MFGLGGTYVLPGCRLELALPLVYQTPSLVLAQLFQLLTLACNWATFTQGLLREYLKL